MYLREFTYAIRKQRDNSINFTIFIFVQDLAVKKNRNYRMFQKSII